MASAFASGSAFRTFDNCVQPSISFASAAPVRSWQEEVDDTYVEDFAGRFTLAENTLEESWSLESLLHLETILLGDQSNDAGSSSGLKAESAYLSVSYFPRSFSSTLTSS